MTDKQIIIDGVPVQDCCYFDYENDGYEDSCYIHQNECSAQNCYYKQYKAKEQECEELKEEIAKATMEICNQCGEKDDYNIPCKQIRDLDYGLQLEIEENDKLKQTLTEIEKLAIKGDIYCFDYNVNDCEKCIKQNDCKTTLFKQILQKISECEVE